MTAPAPQAPVAFEPSRYMHFIWAGGTKLLPAKNLDVIHRWLKANPEITIILWVDKATMAPETDFIGYYRDLLPQEIEVVDCTVNPDMPRGNQPQIQIHDVRGEQLLSEYARYQMSRLDPNYGASSDCIRLAVLNKYGLAYADSDVLPGDKTLSQFREEHPELADGSCAFITLFTQNSHTLGNDFLLATPNNPLLKAMLLALEHPLRDCPIPPSLLAYGQDSIQLKINFTLATSGPTFLRRQLAQHLGADFALYRESDAERARLTAAVAAGCELKVESEVVTVSGIDKQYSKCLRNDFNWLKVPITRCDDEKEAMAAILNTIDYELSEIGIIRLDDHLTHLLTSLHKKPSESPEIIGRFLQAVENRIQPKLDEINVCQLTFRYPQTEAFCKRHENLMDKTMLMHFHIRTIEIIRQVCRTDDCDMFLKQKVREAPPDSPLEYLQSVSSLIDSLRQAASGFLSHFNKKPREFFFGPGSLPNAYIEYYEVSCATLKTYQEMYDRIKQNLHSMDNTPACAAELQTTRKELESFQKAIGGLKNEIQALEKINPVTHQKQPNTGCAPNCLVM